jgi:hypothetical protein
VSNEGPWRHLVGLRQARDGVGPFVLAPDQEQRETIARALGLDHLTEFQGDVVLRPWLDGVEISGRLQALAGRTCGLTLEPFDERVDETFIRRIVSQASAAASQTIGGELVIDPEAEDPPDVADGDTIDLGAILVEELALALDPFPRKPGAAFEAPPSEALASPFAVLRSLKPGPGG